MSSFNTPCTDNKCFIPLTCLYACFVLPSLIKAGGEGGEAAAKILFVNNSSGSVPWVRTEGIWGWGSGCAPLSEVYFKA